MDKRTKTEVDRPGGKSRKRVPVLLLCAAGLLILTVFLLDRVVSGRARGLQARISAEQLASASAAESDAAAFQDFLAGGAAGSHSLDGPGISRFIAWRYGSLVPESVGAWRIVLAEGRAVVEGVIDLKGYLREMGMEQPVSLSGYTGQDVPFSFRGRLDAAGGRGRFTVEEVALLGLKLPLDLVERVAGSGGGEHSVLNQQFTLPDGISDAAIEGDRIVINGGRH